MNKSPYSVIKSRYITEKTSTLEQLKDKESNRSLRKCKSPKYAFLVDPKANKVEIGKAVEEIYASQKIKVVKVNTICVKPKRKFVRGRVGFTNAFKKAIVTLKQGDQIGDQV